MSITANQKQALQRTERRLNQEDQLSEMFDHQAAKEAFKNDNEEEFLIVGDDPFIGGGLEDF